VHISKVQNPFPSVSNFLPDNLSGCLRGTFVAHSAKNFYICMWEVYNSSNKRQRILPGFQSRREFFNARFRKIPVRSEVDYSNWLLKLINYAIFHAWIFLLNKYYMLRMLCDKRVYRLLYRRKSLTSCSKSANKPSTSCLRTACPKLSTSLEQAVNNL
jgi:hypothetical protein